MWAQPDPCHPAGPFPWPEPAVASLFHSLCPTPGLLAGNSLPYSVPSFLPVCLSPLCWPLAPRLACCPLHCGRLPRAPPAKVASPLPVLSVSRRCPAMCVRQSRRSLVGRGRGVPAGMWFTGRQVPGFSGRGLRQGVGVRAWDPDIHMYIFLRTPDLWALEGSGGPRMHGGEGHP